MLRHTALLLLTLALLSGCAAKPTPVPCTPMPTYTPYPTLAPLATLVPLETLAPLPTYTLYPTYTSVPKPTDKPTNTPVPTASIGTRSQPVPFGQSLTITEKDTEATIKITQVLRHAEADKRINDPNSYVKSVPQNGMEFYAVLVAVDYTRGNKNTAKSFDDGDWSIDVQNTLLPNTLDVSEGVLDALLYPGGKTTGHVLFQIPKGTDPDRVRYDKFLGNESYWFALK